MKILVTGASGQLGHDVIIELRAQGHTPIGTDIAGSDIPMDITDEKSVRQVILDVNPDAVIHCAAWTAVDAAEEEENLGTVYNINHLGTKNIALACKELNIKMLYVSTDYVFDGCGDTPWKSDMEDFNPINIYGDSKLKGEEEVRSILSKYFIVRIQWVYGIAGKNFIKTMLSVGKKYPEVRVVNDQIGSTTYTKDLARLFAQMIVSDKYGCYHARNEGDYISWYDLTCKLFSKVGYTTKVTPVTTVEYGLSKAKRPYNSRLDTSALSVAGFSPLPHWEDALDRYLKELADNNLL